MQNNKGTLCRQEMHEGATMASYKMIRYRSITPFALEVTESLSKIATSAIRTGENEVKGEATGFVLGSLVDDVMTNPSSILANPKFKPLENVLKVLTGGFSESL